MKDLIPHGPWAVLWHVFAERCFTRLRQGAIEYGDRSFSLGAKRLGKEIREEIADQATWSFILDRKVAWLVEAIDKLNSCPHCGGRLVDDGDE